MRDELNRHYWDGAQEGRLVLLQCPRCEGFVHPPRPRCTACGHEGLQPADVAGTGTVYSWSVMHSPGNPGFDSRIPFTVLVVELDEQPGLLTIGNLLEASPDDLAIGAPVEVVFEKVTAEVTLPQWRLSGRSR